MLCGLLAPTEGDGRVAGFDLRRAAAQARQRLGYMAQKFSLYGDLTVRQNFAFFSGAYGLGGRRRRTKNEQIGRASCRAKVSVRVYTGGRGMIKKKNKKD